MKIQVRLSVLAAGCASALLTYFIVLLICGKEDHAGSCIRYNKAWHKSTGIPIEWIEKAGHNSNTDAPETVNALIEKVIQEI